MNLERGAPKRFGKQQLAAPKLSGQEEKGASEIASLALNGRAAPARISLPGVQEQLGSIARRSGGGVRRQRSENELALRGAVAAVHGAEVKVDGGEPKLSKKWW